jgi:hypothetical protein
MASGLRYEVYTLDAKILPIRLMQKGLGTAWDITAATAIDFYAKRTDAAAGIVPINWVAEGAGETWAEGRIRPAIGASDVTATVGTWEFSIVVTIGGETITAVEGIIEVTERPGLPIPA